MPLRVGIFYVFTWFFLIASSNQHCCCTDLWHSPLFQRPRRDPGLAAGQVHRRD